MINELKKNKYTTIVLCIFLGLFLIGWLLFSIIMPSDNNAKYGERLDDISSTNEITKRDTDSLVEKIKEKDGVSNCKINIEGKVVNIIVEMKSGVGVSKGKKLTSVITKNLSESQLNTYDLQLYITNQDSSAKGYPVIGYKGSTAKSFSF